MTKPRTTAIRQKPGMVSKQTSTGLSIVDTVPGANEALDAAMVLLTDKGIIELTEVVQAHTLLTAAGVPEMDSLADRIVWVAEHWISTAKHTDGCADRLCTSARKVVNRSKEMMR